MTDLIRRADAIEVLGEEPEIIFDTAAEWEMHDRWVDAMTSIKALPSAEAVQGWIPCSKKMPDEDGEYLVTFNGKFIDNIIKVMFYEVEKKCFSLYFPGAGDITFQEVRAWMPLPKPYREEREVEE